MRKIFIALVVMCLLLTIHHFGRRMLPTLLQSLSPVVALSSTPDPTATQERAALQVVATPTVAALFRSAETIQLLATSKAQPNTSASSAINVASTVSSIITSQVRSSIGTDITASYQEVVIYADELDQNWSLAESNGVQYLPWNTSHWNQPLDEDALQSSGATSIAVTPEQDYGTLVFSVRADSTVHYRRSDIIGISFWLNSGDTIIEPDDLAVTVVGADAHAYWTGLPPADTANDDQAFSETRLYYLDVNRSIPPNSWVNIVVWLDKLIYDPSYTYLTGFYIKNDIDIRNTYYVDQVSLLMLDTP